MKTLQQIAAKALREIVTEPVVNWRKVYKLERRFHLVGYSDHVLGALKESRRAYVNFKVKQELFQQN